MKSSSNRNSATLAISSLITTSSILFTTSILTYLTYNHIKRKQESRWLEIEEEIHETSSSSRNLNTSILSFLWKDEIEQEEEEQLAKDSIPSIISHFESLIISNPNATISEANKKRTQSYYEKMRDGHLQNLVLGEGLGYRFKFLVLKRHKEMERIMRYYNGKKAKSHRTVVVMCDSYTSSMLNEARELILQPLNYSTDIYTKNVWIPELNIIPNEDMHVTVALPWWWHTIKENNYELSTKLCNRFRQAIIKGMHHPFQIELERIVLLGGKSLVALWRTVGERRCVDESGDGDNDEYVICDRHSDGIDPFVRLRREVADCFIKEDIDIGNHEPLTYSTFHAKDTTITDTNTKIKFPSPPGKIQKRQHTIEEKTPGLHSKDGFIHTTLCRLPLHCLSSYDVNLEHVHRLCREATATYCGHRMNVHKFRFLETTGEGGESNPCYKPIFDDTVYAPLKYENSTMVSNYDESNSNTIGHSIGNTRASVFDLFEKEPVTEE